MSTSVLDDATLAGWRAEAHASPFVSPALLREAERSINLPTDEWLSRVIGRALPVSAWRHMTNAEFEVAVRALRADRTHLEALAAERRAEVSRFARADAQAREAARQAGVDEWRALAARLPVPVEVWHNWTVRHLDGYEQGADHIVVLGDLAVGRFRRNARYPLCWTPSRARELRHVSGNVGDDKRVPTCKACLQHAERLAA